MANDKIHNIVNYQYLAEKQAVGQMLIIALRHGFQLDELIQLANKYQTCVAVLEYHNNHSRVNFATREGYFTHQFDGDIKAATDFVERFDIWWYQ